MKEEEGGQRWNNWVREQLLRGVGIGEGSMAEGGACWLLRLWVAYMDCRQMSNLMR